MFRIFCIFAVSYLKKYNIMEKSNVLFDTVLRNRGIDSISAEILSIRKQLDLIWFCMPDDAQLKSFVFNLQNVSKRLTDLYSKMYAELCK